jgi:hypothetical protein
LDSIGFRGLSTSRKRAMGKDGLDTILLLRLPLWLLDRHPY